MGSNENYTFQFQIQSSLVEPFKPMEMPSQNYPLILPPPYDVNNCLIVNYLPKYFSEESLHNIFLPYGPMHSVHVMRTNNGTHMGYGFVNFLEFKDAEAAQKDMDLRCMGTKVLRVSFVQPPTMTLSEDQRDSSVYVSNLFCHTSEDDLKEMFQPCGTIMEIKILYEKRNGVSRGIAFIRFANPTEATACLLQWNDTILDGATTPIVVKYAKDC